MSSTAAVAGKAERLKAGGVEIVDFGAGQPDFSTPENVKRAAVEALEQDYTKYTDTGGTPELKEAVIERHAADFGSNYTAAECIVTVGGKHAVFEAVAATVSPGDDVILPVPYWASFPEIIRYAGGRPVLLRTSEDDNFALRAEAVEKSLTPATRMLIVNSPCNPSGAVVPSSEMEKILHLAARRGILVVSDETYSHFTYGVQGPYSLGTTRNRENLVVIGSLSKTYAMTGWRIGYALGSAPLIANMLTLQSHSTSNPTSFAQKGAVEALRGPQDAVRRMRAEYQRRRDRIVAGLRAIPGISCTNPEGAFYVYPNLGKFLDRDGMADTTALAAKLLDQARVAVVPGPGFGTAQHVRISYATSMQQIDEGLRRMQDFFAHY